MPASNSINESTPGIVGFTGTAFVGTPVTQYNVLTGSSTSSTINNVAPSTSGVPLISSGAAVQPAFGTAVVAGGGTGNTTFTAYSVIAAGTTSTGVFQNVSGLGSSGNALTSNGAGALPTWQAISSSSGSSYFMNTTGTASPVDATTYYLAQSFTLTNFTATNNSCRYYMSVAGTINKVYGTISVEGTLGSSENATLAFRKNDTTNTNISTTLQLTSASVPFNNTSLGISVVASDFVEILFIAPTWATEPTNVNINLTFVVD